MKTEFAPDIKEKIDFLVKKLEFSHIDSDRIVCMRSTKSTTNARARIWSLPNIWQKALNVEAHYVIEAVSENFDYLSSEEKEKVLIHELLHIPKTFSGSLLSHRAVHFDGKGGHKIRRLDRKMVDELFHKFLK